jgi:ParB family transcriptional regulator, chromosome partitioning protein
MPAAAPTSGIQHVPVKLIDANPQQPRREFDEASLADLAASIRQHGVLQPLVVSLYGGRYRLIAGERRLRAAGLAGLRDVPVIVREASEQQRLELALIENIQREDLNPLEEAAAYRRLQNEFNLTQEQVATQVGKSRSQVANTERLLALPAPIQAALKQGTITVGHAKVILSLEGEAEQQKFFETLMREGLPVRLAEAKARSMRVRTHERTVRGVAPELKELERELQQVLGARVRVRGNPSRGIIEIAFFSSEDLSELARKLTLRG